MNKNYLLVFSLLFFYQSVAAQVDTLSPVLGCKNIHQVHLSNFCHGYLKVQDVVDTVYDDSQYYELSFRLECTGEGFPSTDSLLFLASDFSSNVEIWARDSTGNTSTCKMTMYFYAHAYCDGGASLLFTTPDWKGIDSVSTHVYGSNCLLDSLDYHIPTTAPWWHSWTPGNWISYAGFVPAAGYNDEVVPSRNNDPLNGITTYDLVLISKHILGTEPFDSPYKLIAADVNMDGKVTTYDMVLIRKLILGISPQLPHGKSWRFIPQGYVFPNPQNPFNPPIPDRIIVPRTNEFPYGSPHFIGIKMGDVNYSADPD